MDFACKDKIALVTGSSRGLGFVIAKGLGEYGAVVILNGRNIEELDKAQKILLRENVKSFIYPFDVSNVDEVSRSIDDIESKVGCIDILINNAGIQRRHSAEDFPIEEWDEIIDINLKSAFIVSQKVGKYMISRRKGKIINICSIQSELARNTITPYAASKGGLKMLTKGLATEWAKYNIQVNGLGPGYFKSEMTRALWENPEFDKWLCNRVPANRWGDPSELIGPIIFLSSDASNYVNGQILYVDGGMLSCV